jgi:hypothetical protein
MQDIDSNKATVTAFYDLMFNQCKPAGAIQNTPAMCTSSTIPAWQTARKHSSSTSSEWLRVSWKTCAFQTSDRRR